MAQPDTIQLSRSHEAALHQQGTGALSPLRPAADATGKVPPPPVEPALAVALRQPVAVVRVVTSDLWTFDAATVVQSAEGATLAVTQDDVGLTAVDVGEPYALVDAVSAHLGADLYAEQPGTIGSSTPVAHLAAAAAAADALAAVAYGRSMSDGTGGQDPRTVLGWFQSVGLVEIVPGAAPPVPDGLGVGPSSAPLWMGESGLLEGPLVEFFAAEFPYGSPRGSWLRIAGDDQQPLALHIVVGRSGLWAFGPNPDEPTEIEMRQIGPSRLRQSLEAVLVPDDLQLRWVELAHDVDLVPDNAIARLDAGTSIRVIDVEEDWVGIEAADGRTGWIPAAAIDGTAAGEEQTQAAGEAHGQAQAADATPSAAPSGSPGGSSGGGSPGGDGKNWWE